MAHARSVEPPDSSQSCCEGFCSRALTYAACPLSPPAAALIVYPFFPYGMLVTVFIHQIHGFTWNLKVLPVAALFLFHLTMTKEAKVWAL